MSSHLIALAQHRAALTPDEVVYRFLLDGESQEAQLTCGGLDRRARAIGALLQARGARGERVVLLHPPGLDYIAAFFGCLYAGAIAVPAYPPDPSRLERTLPRLETLASDARASFVLTTGALLPLVGGLSERAPRLASLTWLASDEASDEASSAWQNPGVTAESVAFLQYTSGSTGSPRGVVLTHGNLLANSAAIERGFGNEPGSLAVSWLPPYHDMGLIGGVLQPLYSGLPIILFSPLDFLHRPARWLEIIARYGARRSGGPNFAYDLCVRKTTPEQRATLDLSTWELAFNGAEPVRAETLERFCRAFSPSGFRVRSFLACYGLAEGTLCVTAGRRDSAPMVRHFAREALERGEARVVAPGAAQGATPLVGCGAAVAGHELRVVDPETGASLPEGRTGEIWMRGPGVALGYWGRPEETEQTFRAPLDGGRGGHWLRTGDLGFVVEGELFVAGRAKDVIIVRGRNLYPQDLEQTAEACHPALRPGCSAAFGIDEGGEERVAIVLEVARGRAFEPEALAAAVRRAVAAGHDVAPYAVVFIGQGSIPKTSSGKVQRRACRASYLSGGLEAIAVSTLASHLAATPASAPAPLAREALVALAAPERARLVGERLRWLVAALLSTSEAAVDARLPLAALGLDSVRAVELKAAIEEELGVSEPIAGLLGGASLEELTTRVAESLRALTKATRPIEHATRGGPLPLSSAQERLLFLEELVPGNSAYNIAAALSLEGPLDVGLLGRCLATLVRRHESLRASFPLEGGRRVQRVAPTDDVPDDLFAGGQGVTDLRALDEVEQGPVIRRLVADEARKAFDVARGPLVRACLLTLAEQRHVLALALHHLVSDGWSMGVLVRELGALYAAGARGECPPLAELSLQPADFAAWQRRELEAGALDPQLGWWTRRLSGAPPLLELPGAKTRPPAPSLRGARHPLALPEQPLAALLQWGRGEGATPFMSLLAAFLAALHVRTGRTDLVVGTDVAGRDHPAARGLVGLFVNQIVLRVDLSGDPTFGELLGRTREAALGAYAHAELPFDRLVEALRPPRDARRNPLFQVMFVLENAPLPELSLPGLSARALEADEGGAPFDLSVLLSESSGRLGGVMRYDAALYDEAVVARLAGAFDEVIGVAAARPGVRLAGLCEAVAESDRRREIAEAAALRDARDDKFKRLRRRGEG